MNNTLQELAKAIPAIINLVWVYMKLLGGIVIVSLGLELLVRLIKSIFHSDTTGNNVSQSDKTQSDGVRPDIWIWGKHPTEEALKKPAPSTDGASDQWLNRKGQWQENKIAEELESICQSDGHMKYQILRNVYVPWLGKTEEIDVMLICEKGIYIFESKNFGRCFLVGDIDSLKWCQCKPDGTKKQFYNPIKQNEVHIQAIQKFLGNHRLPITSCIVFSNQCRWKDSIPEGANSLAIMALHDLDTVFPAMLQCASEQFTQEQVRSLSDRLQHESQQHTREEHISAIVTKCPFCGGDLVLREGPYSRFWGCTRYPRCHFTKPLSSEEAQRYGA